MPGGPAVAGHDGAVAARRGSGPASKAPEIDAMNERIEDVPSAGKTVDARGGRRRPRSRRRLELAP
jgi:hypothetical protein